jgi:dTDP-4-dehydrorhamnose reductase
LPTRKAPTTSRFRRETVALLRREASGVLHLVPSARPLAGVCARDLRKACKSTPQDEEFPTARRPANSVLDNRKAAAILGRGLADWRTLLDAVRQSA